MRVHGGAKLKTVVHMNGKLHRMEGITALAMPRRHFVPRSFIVDAENKSPRELAERYGVSLSTVYRWKRAIRAGDHQKLQRDFEIDGRILAILWALGRDDGAHFLTRYRDRSILEEVCSYFGVSSQIITARSLTGAQYRLKLTGDVRQSILDAPRKHGWSARTADIRQYPQ